MASNSNEHVIARRQQMCKLAFIKNTTRRCSDPPTLQIEKPTPQHIITTKSPISTSTSVTSSSSFTLTDCCSKESYTGLRIDYDIGDKTRTQSDMIIEDSPQKATDAADSLQKYNFAFVKRSDGTYSYAILAVRLSDSLVFAMDTDGSRKEVSRKRWSEMVRLVSSKPRHSRTSDTPRRRQKMPNKSVHPQ